ncbi:aromatic amino acid lyase [Antribacter sp. KLBMP9083]|uniref:Aromatic amino acid lyase n=1 Tax=Antribacter soli TaxID=2910976 RepID=A0AA41U7U1_9MICO|nr:aromatic amino acid lyase [Antribacter soli]MCF4119747.1 aromatic amino acid lyase [Antribacter soli]
MAETVQMLLALIDGGPEPETWQAARSVVKGEHEALVALVQGGGDGYGVTTGVGHRDRDRLVDIAAFQGDLLASHLLPGLVWADRLQSRCISLVKVHQLSRGGTGCSPEAFDAVVAAALDPDFAPPVPLDVTYSSGDVICGTWWAKGLLQHEHLDLGPKGALSLINGSFVHLGVALALVPALRSGVATTERVVRAALVAGRAKQSARYLGGMPEGAMADRLGQDPVAIRAAEDVLDTLRHAQDQFEAVLEEELSRQSDNPLVAEGRLVEQASFLAPRLALATSALFDAWSLVGAWVDRAVTWLCYGAGGLAPDLADDERLGFIQVPKLVAAHVHRLRGLLSPRPFSAGGATSHDIEDLWTHGVMMSSVLRSGLGVVHEMLAVLAVVVSRAVEIGAPAEASEILGGSAGGTTLVERIERARPLLGWSV